jgi:membrane associated rhomboid family serine protease
MVMGSYDRNPARRVPIFTWALIAANIVVFVLSPLARAPFTSETTAQLCGQEAFFYHWGAVSRELTHNSALPYTVGPPAGPSACLTVRTTYTKYPALSSVTSMFLHAGWLQLLGSVVFLFLFGGAVEDRFGRGRYLLLYLLTGVVSTYAFAFTQAGSTAPLVCASGAIAGVLGAYLVLFPRAKAAGLMRMLYFLPGWLPAWVVLALWFGLQAIYARGWGMTGGASAPFLGAVFGFLLGMILAAVFAPRRPYGGYRQRRAY